MSAITSIDQLDPQRRYTYADYLSWQIQERVELLRGYIRRMLAIGNWQLASGAQLERSDIPLVKRGTSRLSAAKRELVLVRGAIGPAKWARSAQRRPSCPSRP